MSALDGTGLRRLRNEARGCPRPRAAVRGGFGQTIACVSPDDQPPAVIDVRLLTGQANAGCPVSEVLPARVRDIGLVELLGSPGLVLGCAADDVLRIDTNGDFKVVEQGESPCVQAARLSDHVTPNPSLPSGLRFVVVTIARSIGLPAIAGVMERLVR